MQIEFATRLMRVEKEPTPDGLGMAVLVIIKATRINHGPIMTQFVRLGISFGLDVSDEASRYHDACATSIQHLTELGHA